MNILLICASGMSTSLLVTKMIAEGELRKIENLNIFACSVDEIDQHIDNYDVVLLGPQIRYKLNSVSALATSKNKGCAVIDSISYGRVDGKSTLDQAISLIKN